MSESIVLQQPEPAAEQLLLLFHGYGATPADLLPLGRRLAQAFPRALVVSVCAPDTGDSGRGYQWFSVAGITEENRPARVLQAMPAFRAEIARWQAAARLGQEATALIGFSQGAIMALESVQAGTALAARVVALAGRYAQLPTAAAQHTTVHLIHGKEDRVIHYGLAIAAAEHLQQLDADVTADILPFVGHEIAEETARLAVERLQSYVPQWRWREALQAEERAGRA